MASNKRALAICDTCGFQYPHRVMRMNSYGMLVCPEDWEGAYDLKNSPLNKAPNVKDNTADCVLVNGDKEKLYDALKSNKPIITDDKTGMLTCNNFEWYQISLK